MASTGNWLDRIVGYVAPQAGLRRQRARVATDLLRHYEGSAAGRRTQGWRTSSGDANAVIGPAVARLRDVARDLVRNTPDARSALRNIVNDVVGWGIVAKPKPKHRRAAELWAKWAETTACDSDGRLDFYGLQKLVMRTVAESGEVLVRRRFRLPEDELPIPVQLQVLDPDYLDTLKTGPSLMEGGQIVNGVEFNPIGQRVAYWLFPDHPGSEFSTARASVRIRAENVLHIYYQERPGQARGVTWFSSVLLRSKDLDEFEDATLMKQKVAACLALVIGDLSGEGLALGTADASANPQIDSLEPGWIGHVPQGTTVETVAPPTVREYSDYTQSARRGVASGIGVTYEDMTGDYAGMPFSAARMSRLSHWKNVEDWRWQMLIPQFCNPAWDWAMQVAGIFGLKEPPAAEWTAPPAPMIDPANEGLAHQRRIRNGLATQSEVIRELGYDPDDFFSEMAAERKKLKAMEIILDSNPNDTTQAGLPRETAKAQAPAPAPDGGQDDEETPPKKEPKPPNGEAEAEP